jgi:hypothetical protein
MIKKKKPTTLHEAMRMYSKEAKNHVGWSSPTMKQIVRAKLSKHLFER